MSKALFGTWMVVTGKKTFFSVFCLCMIAKTTLCLLSRGWHVQFFFFCAVSSSQCFCSCYLSFIFKLIMVLLGCWLHTFYIVSVLLFIRFRCLRYVSHNCHAALVYHDNVYTRTGTHSHSADHAEICRLEFVNWCKEQARTTNNRLFSIYEQALIQ